MRSSGLIAAIFLLGLGIPARAEGPVTAPDEGPSSPVLQPAQSSPPAAAAKSPGHDHLVSTETSGRVTNGLPKYAPKPANANPDAEPPDLREIDRPKNTIIRLPKYVLTKPKERPPPVLTERQLLTPQGLIDLALKRNPGLKFGNIFGLNNGMALAMYMEQERLDNLAAMADVAANARRAGDTANANAINRALLGLSYRPSDIGGAEHAAGQ